MALDNINNHHAALKDTISLVLIVSSVILPNIGTPSTKDVLLVMLDTSGMPIATNAHAANCQDKSSEPTAFAHHQSPSGTMPQRPAHAHQTPSETTVSHAQPQESGTMEPTPANAHPQQASGTDNNVSAQLENTDHNVLNAQHQDTGILLQTNVFVKSHSSGTDKTVSAHHHTFCIKEDVPSAQRDILGKTTNVKLVHALSRIWKS
jgi:hypothetical protein